MIAQILSSTSSFNAVRYNTNKMETGKGELMKIKNMAQFDRDTVKPEDIKSHLKSFSAFSKRGIKNAQFHVAISAKGREFDKDQLTNVAEKYMDKMGYGDQPYIIVFHGDTENNHVHIVSTRVNSKGEKINSNFERYRSQRVMSKILKEEYNKTIDTKGLKNLLEYQVSNLSQFKKLLEHNGYVVSDDDKAISIYKDGIKVEEKELEDLKLTDDSDKKRLIQIKAIFEKYKNDYSTDLVPLYEKLKGDRQGKIIGYTSEFGEYLSTKFGIDLIYHFSENKTPFGYTVIDNKNKSVYKGSDVLKMKLLLSDAKEVPVKKRKEIDNYNVSRLQHIKVLSKFYNVPEWKINQNERQLSKQDLDYYKGLLKIVTDNGTLNDVRKFGLIPIVEDNELFILDKSSLNMVDAKDVVDLNIINEYLEQQQEQDVEQDTGINIDISFGSDVDDEQVHGKERNKNRKKR